MEPGRQFQDMENRILKVTTPKFEANKFKLIYGRGGSNHYISAVTPSGKIVGSVSINVEEKHTAVVVHPDYQQTAVSAHLLAAASKFSNEKLGAPLYGDRQTTDKSFALVKKYFPPDSTKISMREPQRPATKSQITEGLREARESHAGNTKPSDRCFTCYGAGFVKPEGNIHITSNCPDCKGTGIEFNGRTVKSELGL